MNTRNSRNLMKLWAEGGVKVQKKFSVSRQTMSRLEMFVNRLIAAWVFGVLFIGSALLCAYHIPPLPWCAQYVTQDRLNRL